MTEDPKFDPSKFLADISTQPPAAPEQPDGDEVVRNAENAVRDLVSHINNRTSPEEVVNSIGAHTKSIISQAALTTRRQISKLQDALNRADLHIKQNEQRLRDQIDRHMHIANSAGRAATAVEKAVEEWIAELEPMKQQ